MRPHLSPIMLLSALLAVNACSKDDAPSGPASSGPAPAAPTSVAIDLSPAGATWKGLTIQAPAGTLVNAMGPFATVTHNHNRQVDSKDLRLNIIADGDFAGGKLSAQRLQEPTDKLVAAVDTPDTYVAAITRGTVTTYEVVVSTKVGNTSYLCTYPTNPMLHVAIHDLAVAQRHVDACKSLAKP